MINNTDLVPPTIIHHADCDVENQFFSPERRLNAASISAESYLLVTPIHPEISPASTLPVTPSIHPEIPQPITATPNSKKRTNQPDSPKAYPSVGKIHEYIKGKVMVHGIEDELLTTKFYDYIELLQRMHKDFKPMAGPSIPSEVSFPMNLPACMNSNGKRRIHWRKKRK
jgi:hypothetical protein